MKVWGKLESFSNYIKIDKVTAWGWENTAGTVCQSDWSCENVYSSMTVNAGVGNTSDWAVAISFTLDANAPLDPVKFDLSFHDSLGYSWNDNFTVEVS